MANLKSFVFFGVLFFGFHCFSFCLQTFNGYGPAYAPFVSSRTSEFSAEIKADGCEVVHLQEIWTGSQINIVKQTLGSDYKVFSPNVDHRIGVMSLSKFPVGQTGFHIFYFNNDGGLLDGGRDLVGVQKGFAVQTLLVQSQPTDFLNLHLHPASQNVRLAQIFEIILWRLGQTAVKPLVMSGDFNMTPSSLEHQFLAQVLKLKDSVEEMWGKYPPSFCTYCSANRLGWLQDDRIFDYVLFSENLDLKVTDVQVDLKGTAQNPLSDHYGLKVSFDFGAAAPARNLEADRDLAIHTLELVMKGISDEYTKASRIYNQLGLWHQQLVKREGAFWDYFAAP